MSEVSRDVPKLSNEEVQTIDRALNMLKQAIGLPSHDPHRRDAAVSLRNAGFTANQIVRLSGGAWPRQSVQRWIEHVHAAANAPAERAIEIIADAVERGRSLDHILAGLDIEVMLAVEGVSVDDILGVVKGVKDEAISLHDLIEHYKMMKETGLQFADVKRHLEYKKSLEKNGFGLDSLRQIQTAAQKYGNPDTVLKAIDTYVTIQDLQKKLDELMNANDSEENRRSTLNTAVTELGTKQTNLQKEIQDNENTIQQLKRVLELGYNLESLRDLHKRSQTLGGIEPFLTTLAKYDTLTKLEDAISKTATALNNHRANSSKLEAENLQYKTEIDTTRTLIKDHKLGLQAFQELLQLCEKYGAPENVFRAIRAYDNLKALESKTTSEQNKLAELQEQEKQLTEKLNKHIPEIERTLHSIQESFQKDTNETKTALRTDLDNLLTAVHEAGKSYQKLVATAKENEPYLELLDIVKDPQSVRHNPRVLTTTELILRKLLEWIPLNDSVFRYATNAKYELTPKIKALIEELAKTEYIRR